MDVVEVEKNRFNRIFFGDNYTYGVRNWPVVRHRTVLYFRFSGSKCPNFKHEILAFTSQTSKSEVLTLSSDIKTTKQFFRRTCFFSSVRESADCIYFRELIWVDADAGLFFKPTHSCIDINTWFAVLVTPITNKVSAKPSDSAKLACTK